MVPATVMVSHCYVFSVLSPLMVVQTFYIYMLEVDKIHLKFHHLMKYCQGEFSDGLRDDGQPLVDKHHDKIGFLKEEFPSVSKIV